MECLINKHGLLEIHPKKGMIKFTNFEVDDGLVSYALVHGFLSTEVSTKTQEYTINEKIKTICKVNLSDLKKQIRMIIGQTNIDNIKKVISKYIDEKGNLKKSDFPEIVKEIEALEEVKDSKNKKPKGRRSKTK